MARSKSSVQVAPCRSTSAPPPGFPPPPDPQAIPGGGSFAVGIRESVMPDLYDLPFDLEKLLQSVRRLNGLRQTDQPDQEILDFVESNWPYLSLAKHSK